ncbi:MAG TPA: DUF302 domain-containing protein [Streptosporangiaceae bacterium]
MFAEAVAQVREALKAQGFGVLTEIDVRATLREELGQEMEDYLILGACNPSLAHQALGVDASTGLLLPCNVVVRTEAGQVLAGVGLRDAKCGDQLADSAGAAAEVVDPGGIQSRHARSFPAPAPCSETMR